ncbi:carboxypeptidase regulatory-like domain-containing protein [Chitinophagaceae bacterium 26-R-25]|nr:carboxypeptidase regulatory-like domain-containing protein [Chitinophagaceae bacterium 26-R-25]
MKQLTKLKLGLLGIGVAGLFSFYTVQKGTIKGTVSPSEGAVRAWALSSSDTLRAPVQSGAFEITNAKPGTYRIIIEAKPPYKNIAKDDVNVTEGQPTDVGEIKLQQ